MTTLISVVFPAPLGPTTAIRTPAGTSMSTSQRTGLSPYATVRSSTLTAGPVSLRGIVSAPLREGSGPRGAWAGKRRDDGVDVMTNHSVVCPFRRSGIAHRVREEAAPDIHPETLRFHRFLERLDVAGRHRGLDEHGGDSALDDQPGKRLDVRRAGLGHGTDPLEASHPESVCPPEIVEGVVGGDEHPFPGGYDRSLPPDVPVQLLETFPVPRSVRPVKVPMGGVHLGERPFQRLHRIHP